MTRSICLMKENDFGVILEGFWATETSQAPKTKIIFGNPFGARVQLPASRPSSSLRRR